MSSGDTREGRALERESGCNDRELGDHKGTAEGKMDKGWFSNQKVMFLGKDFLKQIFTKLKYIFDYKKIPLSKKVF